MTVGIDIGGHSHAVARCRAETPKADREVLRVSQSRAGFAALDAWLERQTEPVSLVTMESSGHYWMPLASHLRRHAVPVAVVNPLAAKYFAKSRLARTKSDPADARSLAEMAMRDTPATRDPLGDQGHREAGDRPRRLHRILRKRGIPADHVGDTQEVTVMARHELGERRLVAKRGRSHELACLDRHRFHHAIEIRVGERLIQA